MHEVSVTRVISTGHRIVGHQGKCRYLHGHNYEVEVVLYAEELDSLGFVEDFGIIKEVIDRWDHKTILWDKDPIQLVLGEFPDLDVQVGTIEMAMNNSVGIIRVPFNPTAEQMAKHLAETFYAWDRIRSCSVMIAETGSTEATYYLP